jgi:HAE1 family hydrophobic/amphiphilic exporter-1
MISIPLALIGVFYAFVIMDYSFDSTAYIGCILLGGIVVNNSILLIDNINRHLKQTKNIIDAITIGAKERIRPIFMTSATTVLGMMPLIILKKADSSDIWSSLALCTVGGLTTSAFLILFVLPIFYYLFYKLQKNIFNPKKGH